MKRMGRWMLNGLTVLSLLVCVATVGLWVRSRFTGDMLSWCTDSDGGTLTQTISLRSGYGAFQIEDYHLRFKQRQRGPEFARWVQERHGWWLGHPSSRHLPIWTRPQLQLHEYDDVLTGPYDWPDVDLSSPPFSVFRDRSEDEAYANTWRGWVVPYRLAAGVTCVLPIAWLAMIPRRRRRPSHPRFCSSCNYNLTGNVSGICPECGKAIVRAE